MATNNAIDDFSSNGFTVNNGLKVSAGSTTLTPIASTAATGIVTINSSGVLSEVETGGSGTVFVGTLTSPKFLAAGTPGDVLTSQGAGFDPQWMPPGLGLTQYSVVVGASTGGITSIPLGSNNQILMGNTSANPFFTGSPSFSGTITANGLIVGSLALPLTTSPKIGVFQWYYGALSSATAFIQAYGTNNTFMGEYVGSAGPSGTFILNTANATDNVAIGVESMRYLVGASTGQGCFNVAVGVLSLTGIINGTGLTAWGVSSSGQNQYSNYGSAFGHSSMSDGDGSNNTAFGFQSAVGNTSNYNNFISINGATVYGSAPYMANNRLRIGQATGSSAQYLNKAYISGIQTTSVIGNALSVSSSDQFGATSSSIRFKENIEDMNEYSHKIMDLRPVSFTYKKDTHKTKQYGLIAEEVAKLFPDLVSYDKDGTPFSVYYEKLPSILLNELQKLIKRKEYIKLKLEEI